MDQNSEPNPGLYSGRHLPNRVSNLDHAALGHPQELSSMVNGYLIIRVAKAIEISSQASTNSAASWI